jgi:DNA-directed RNA polymerase subunit omega
LTASASWRTHDEHHRLTKKRPIATGRRATVANLGVARSARLRGPTTESTRTLISPRIDKLLEHVDSDYASVLVAAKRARQINSYYHNLGEGTFDEFPPPMVETRSKNYLTIALEEVAQGKLKYHYR